MIADLVLACCLVHPNLVILAETVAKANGIEPTMFHALILVESNYKPDAINGVAPVHSFGLTQITVDTAKDHCRLGRSEIMDPKKNLSCGAKVLKYQLHRYGGDAIKALSAYNAGTFTTKNSSYASKVYSRMVALTLNRRIDLD